MTENTAYNFQDKSDLNLGKKAVSHGLITAQQLVEVIELQEKYKEIQQNKKIADILVERKYIPKNIWEQFVLRVDEEEDDDSDDDAAIPTDDTMNLSTIPSESVMDVIEDDEEVIVDNNSPHSTEKLSCMPEEESRAETMMIFREVIMPDDFLTSEKSSSKSPSKPSLSEQGKSPTNVSVHDTTKTQIVTPALSKPIDSNDIPTTVSLALKESLEQVVEHTNPLAAETLFQPTVKKSLPKIEGYRLIDKIGEGAMGTVYKAIQNSTNKEVAIKILDKRFTKDSSLVERFDRERRVIGKLNHENVVSAIDSGSTGDSIPFYVMEFIDGVSLGKQLEKGKLIIDQALDYTSQIAKALEYARKQNIIHRDIKPENIMITKNGLAKLCDLGLAREVNRESNLTIAGYALGTPQYISPEQAQGLTDVDIRSDIYSLGVSLFHMVTGQVPFPNQNPAVVCSLHITNPLPDPKQLNPSIPLSVCKIIKKCTEKERKMRYQRPTELLQDLQRCRESLKNNASKNGEAITAYSNETSAQNNKLNIEGSEKKFSTQKPKVVTPIPSAELPKLLPVEENIDLEENLYDTSEMRKKNYSIKTPSKTGLKVAKNSHPTTIPSKNTSSSSRIAVPPNSSQNKSLHSSSISTKPSIKNPNTSTKMSKTASRKLWMIIILCSLLGSSVGLGIHFIPKEYIYNLKTIFEKLIHPSQQIDKPPVENPIANTTNNSVKEMQQLEQAIQELTKKYSLVDNFNERNLAILELMKQNLSTEQQIYLQDIQKNWYNDLEKHAEINFNQWQQKYKINLDSYKVSNDPALLKKSYEDSQICPISYHHTKYKDIFSQKRAEIANLLIKNHIEKDQEELNSLISKERFNNAIKICNKIKLYLPKTPDPSTKLQSLQENIFSKKIALEKSYQEQYQNHQKLYGQKFSSGFANAVLQRNYSSAKKICQEYYKYQGLEEQIVSSNQRIKILSEITESYDNKKVQPKFDTLEQDIKLKYSKTSVEDRNWIIAAIYLHYYKWDFAQTYFQNISKTDENCQIYLEYISKQILEDELKKKFELAKQYFTQGNENLAEYQSKKISPLDQKNLIASQTNYLQAVRIFKELNEKNSQTLFYQKNEKEILSIYNQLLQKYYNTFFILIYFSTTFQIIPTKENNYNFEIHYSFQKQEELDDFVFFPHGNPVEIATHTEKLSSMLQEKSALEIQEKNTIPYHVQIEQEQLRVSFDNLYGGLFAMSWKARTTESNISVEFIPQNNNVPSNIGLFVHKKSHVWQVLDKFSCILYYDWDIIKSCEMRRIPLDFEVSEHTNSEAVGAILLFKDNMLSGNLRERNPEDVEKTKENFKKIDTPYILKVAAINNQINFISSSKENPENILLRKTIGNTVFKDGYIGLYCNSNAAFTNLVIRGKLESNWVEKQLQNYMKMNFKKYQGMIK